jgi:hypothetical protein
MEKDWRKKMVTRKFKHVVLRLNEMSLPIQTLTDLLTNRTFDFKYKLASDGGESVTVVDQKLCASCLKPVRLEVRSTRNHRKECLVFVVEAQDDLLVSVSDWNGALDIEIRNDNEVLITNNDGDWYSLKIHGKEK